MQADFFQRLQTRIDSADTLLCIGLDPRPEDIGLDTAADAADITERLENWAVRIIADTQDYAAAYKPNSAFYEAFGAPGAEALKQIIAAVPDEIPVVLDCKRGDIGATAAAYADSAYKILGADAVTLNAYMGRDAVEPFLKNGAAAGFVLVKTSNPGSADFQQLQVSENGGVGTTLYQYVANRIAGWSPSLGAVVGATDIEALQQVRQAQPDMWILCPGIGAQGGSLERALLASMREDGSGVLPVVARGITQADNPASAARQYRDEIRRVRAQAATQSSNRAKPQRFARVFEGLIREECFRTGEFTLKSGIVSPYYIDLRRVVTSPQLLRDVARAYAEVIQDLEYDRIAGIPVAAVPLATAVALEVGKPMIYPRMEKKKHGTGNRIEGGYAPGEKILLLDDLITTGGSKIEAVDILRDAGLIVDDLVVLLERGGQGRREMQQAAINLHVCARVDELFSYCRSEGIITPDEENRMRSFTDSI